MVAELTRDELVRLTQRTFRLLDDWGVPRELQPQMLGLEAQTPKRHVNRYRLGTPLPREGGSYDAIVLLMRIDNTLRKLFPHSVLSANLWVTTPNPRYGGSTPLDTMLRNGLDGIRQVERSLNCPNCL
jgi:hypothetical protein